MTNKEALQAVIVEKASDNLLDKALLDQSITGAAAYTASDASKIDLAAIDVLQSLLSVPNVSEGGYSVSYDRTAILNRIEMLRAKTNTTLRPVIRDASNRW